jgi:hypothetical protein
MPSNLRRLVFLALAVLPLVAVFRAHSGEAKKNGAEKSPAVPPAMGTISFAGKLEATDPPDRVLGGPCRMYRFKFYAGRTYQLDMISQIPVDAYQHLEGPDGNVIVSDDDGGGYPNSRIIYQCPKDGEYQVVCTALGRNTGPFTLRVTETIPNRPAKAVAPGKPIDIDKQKGGFSVNDQLNVGDLAQAVPNKTAKQYTVTLKKGQSYQIDHMSKDFDCYLYLYSPTGQLLAQDDDGGEGLNSRIVHRAEADGDYVIVATSLGGRSTGAYQFSVRKQ